MASKPTTNRINKILQKISFELKYNIIDSFYIQKIIYISICQGNYDILKLLYNRNYVLSIYELTKFISSVNLKLTSKQKKNIKNSWNNILL